MLARSFACFVSSLAVVACGAKTVLITTLPEDAGIEDAASPPPAHEAAAPPVEAGAPDHSVPCPDLDVLLPLGGACDFVGTCTINLETCDAGVGVATPCVCVDGEVELPPGMGIACAVHTGGECLSGAMCSPGATCEVGTEFCETSCTCESQGTYSCTTECANGGEDAGAPLSACTDPCTGPCLGSNGCGEEEVCACEGGTPMCEPESC